MSSTEKKEGFTGFDIFGMILIVLIAAACGWYFFFGEDEPDPEEYGANIISICQLSPTGQTSQNNMNIKDEGQSKFLILEDSGNSVHSFFGQLPDELKAESAEDLEFVVCIKEWKTKIQACEYSRGITITRRQLNYDIGVFTKTKERIASFTMEGRTPQECAKSIRRDYGDNHDGQILGDPPRYTDFFNLVVSPLAAQFPIVNTGFL